MAIKKIICPGGVASQTGSAALKRCPDSEIIKFESIPAVEHALETEVNPFCVPIWNSNNGEIQASTYVWNYVANEQIKILDLWAQKIVFWHIKKIGSTNKTNLIGSVIVVKEQCKNYIKQLGCEIKVYTLSSEAFDAYKSGDELDGVLIAPPADEAELKGYEVVSKHTVIPNNFTSFVKIQHTHHYNTLPNSDDVFLAGVEIRPLNASLGKSEAEFFKNLFDNASHIDQIPKLLFVFDRTSKVGLLLQSNSELFIEDILGVETIEKNDLALHSSAGSIKEEYTEQISKLISTNFGELISQDFTVYYGNKTCIFICHTLGIYTQGYDKVLVEPVIRFYINSLFEAIYNDTKCTSKQRAFYEKYKDEWLTKKSNFISFKTIT